MTPDFFARGVGAEHRTEKRLEHRERDEKLATMLEEAEGDSKTGQKNSALEGYGADRDGDGMEEAPNLEEKLEIPIGSNPGVFLPEGPIRERDGELAGSQG